ncbi:hypothetical protein [Methanothrix sp.]|jgi:hypothetical protein|uniref:hypothetical protein n=1 Tax=Methanothrix sp. TaxID=90426 RepID=UPI001BD45CFC
MSHRAGDLEEAAASIDAASLDAARKAVLRGCQELIFWLELFCRQLDKVESEELHKFARALSLTVLGHLPTRPEGCPFCIQHGKSQSCQGCGYAATHGRCDLDRSAFNLFIEAFTLLGRAIYQDTEGLRCYPDEARLILDLCISSSRRLTVEMMEDIGSLSTRELMERKSRYLGQMLDALPRELFGLEVTEQWQRVKRALLDYW